MDIKAFEGGFQFGNRGFRSAHLGIVRGADELRNDSCGKYAKDDNHNHDFDQRECRLMIGFVLHWIWN
jgi:hypothetical protein